MNKKGPVIVIEDDEDDQMILAMVFKNLNFQNEVIYYTDGIEALKYLTNSEIEPFLILSDINMPMLTGIELREKIYNNERLRMKCIPYLFFSTSAEQEHIVDAYSKSIQGFFIKPSSVEKLQEVIRKIIEYWQECVSPHYTEY